MAADPRNLEQVVGELAGRIDRIEERLGLRSERREVVPPVEKPTAPPPIPVAPPVAQAVMPPPAVENRARHLEELARKRAEAMAGRTGVPETPVKPPAWQWGPSGESAQGLPPVHVPEQVGRVGGPKVADALKTEMWVGGRLVAVVGSLILAAGLLFGIKMGIALGWFTFPPEYRCAGFAAFGVALIGAGEYVRKKLGSAGTIAASAISGAGLAAIYGVALAAYGIYGLYGAPVAFVLLALICIGGIALGLRAKSLALGVLSLVGAYLNPLLLGRHDASPLVMPAYLIALLVMGLALAGWRPNPFRWLRGVAWGGTVVVGSIWIAAGGVHHPLVVLPFLAVCWGLVHGELWLGARRRPEEMATPLGSRSLRARITRPMIASFAATVWTVGVGILTVAFSGANVHLEQWYIAAAGTAATSVLALMLAGNLRVFRDPPESDAERLGVALWMQAGALLITTISLALSDWTQVVAWLAMGVGAVAAGRWARAKSLEAYGLVVLSIAGVRLMVWDSWQAIGWGWGAGGTAMTALGLVFTHWSLLMAIGGAAWIGAAWLLHRPSGGGAEGSGLTAPSQRRSTLVNLCAGIGWTLPFFGLINSGDRATALAAAGGLWAMTLLAAGRFRSSQLLRIWGVVGLALIALVSCVMHLGDLGFSTWRTTILGLIVSDWSLVLIGLAAVWMFAAWAVRGLAGEKGAAASTGTVAIGVVLLLLSLLTKNTPLGGVCMVWIGIAVLLVGLHAAWKQLALDVMGLAVLAAATALWMSTYLIDQDWLEVKGEPFAHPGLWVAIAIVVAMLGAAAWLWRGGSAGGARRATWPSGVLATVALAGVLLLTSTSLEVARSAGILMPTDQTARGAALTLWWGVFAVGLLITGFAAWTPIVRHAGLGLLFVAVGKVLIFDLAGVADVWRMASCIGLGLLMLGVGVGYAKLSAKLDRRAAEARDGVGASA